MSAIATRTAQQGAVAAAHQFHTVADETDGGFADRAFDPCLGVVLVGGEEVLGDDAIGDACVPGIHRAQHLARTLAPLRCHARIGRHPLAEHCVPQTLDRGQPVGRQFVEHDERADGACVIDIGQGDIVGLAAQSDPDQTSVMLDDGVGVQIVSADAEISRWLRSGDEGERRRIDLRGPEDRLDER